MAKLEVPAVCPVCGAGIQVKRRPLAMSAVFESLLAMAWGTDRRQSVPHTTASRQQGEFYTMSAEERDAFIEQAPSPDAARWVFTLQLKGETDDYRSCSRNTDGR